MVMVEVSRGGEYNKGSGDGEDGMMLAVKVVHGGVLGMMVVVVVVMVCVCSC